MEEKERVSLWKLLAGGEGEDLLELSREATREFERERESERDRKEREECE